MKSTEISGVTPLPENILVIPESVRALMGITLFWSPNMERKYPPQPPSPELVAKIEKRLAKQQRGILWRKTHAFLERNNRPKSKENLLKVYNSFNKMKNNNH